MYTSWAIYSPDVPVFRDDAGTFLEAPWLCSMLTAPAVNAGAVPEHRRREIGRVMGERIERVLAIAAAHGHDTLVLGAWGCGAFKNDPEEIAELFQRALDGPFRGVFALVHFAVLDDRGGRTIGPFARRFAR